MCRLAVQTSYQLFVYAQHECIENWENLHASQWRAEGGATAPGIPPWGASKGSVLCKKMQVNGRN